MSRIFISYRRADSEGYVGRLYDHLAQQFRPEEIFFDVDAIRPGDDFVEALEEAVKQCEVLIAVIGPSWATLTDEDGQRRLDQWNDFVRIEIAAALKQGKVVIPVLVQQAKMPHPDDLPEDLTPLARRNAIELSHQRFGYDVGKLTETIQGLLQFPDEAPPSPPQKPARNPQKEAALKAVRDAIAASKNSPLYKFRVENNYFPVAGEGNADAQIMFIGEAPGKTEAEQGRPFVGPSGDVLAELLGGIGLTRADVYITNILNDHPPGSRDPKPEEIEFYTPFLDQQIEIIQPAVIAPLGRYAMTFILKKFDRPEKREKISAIHGQLLKARASYGEIHIVPMYHPAMVLYTASKKDVLRQDFEKLKFFL